MNDRRRRLPSVDRLLREPAVQALGADLPRALLVRAVREAIAGARARKADPPLGAKAWAKAVAAYLQRRLVPTLRPVINATGVVLHTNLGRAPLAEAAVRAAADAARGYSTLEFDLESGERGSRQVHCAALLPELTGAADALVVNNAASALLLAVNTAAEAGAEGSAGSGRGGGEVVVSRGELIEIGGSFRIPEILGKSGARMVEVGTTNRTRAADYERATGVATRAFLKVHRSNFRLEGFVEEVGPRELAALGERAGVPVIYDLGGGLMVDLSRYGLAGEPTLAEAVASGVTAVVASGDKLLGGPQAGILLGGPGRADFVERCRSNPLARAVRADKLTLAALAATLALYRDGEAALHEVPVLRMLTQPAAELEERALRLAERLSALPYSARPSVVTSRAAVGGGAFPGVEIESRALALPAGRSGASVLARRLRLGAPSAPPALPVIGRIVAEKVLLDLRTVTPAEEDALLEAIRQAVGA